MQTNNDKHQTARWNKYRVGFIKTKQMAFFFLTNPEFLFFWLIIWSHRSSIGPSPWHSSDKGVNHWLDYFGTTSSISIDASRNNGTKEAVVADQNCKTLDAGKNVGILEMLWARGDSTLKNVALLSLATLLSEIQRKAQGEKWNVQEHVGDRQGDKVPLGCARPTECAALSPVHNNNKDRLGSSSGHIYSTFSN